MEFENAVAKTFEVMNNKIAISETMRIEFEKFRRELMNDMDLFMTQNRTTNSDSWDNRELIRKIDELKRFVHDMTTSCDSLYKALKSFK